MLTMTTMLTISTVHENELSKALRTRMRVAIRTSAVMILAALFRFSSKQSQWISRSPNFLRESSFSISGFKIFLRSLSFCDGLGKSYVRTGFWATDCCIIDKLELEFDDSLRALDMEVRPRCKANASLQYRYRILGSSFLSIG